MRAVLELISGPNSGMRIEAAPSELVEVGRAIRIGDGLLQDPHLSMRHFAIAWHGGQWGLRDLGSTNGTFVNGVRVVTATLRSGDHITAGQSIFAVRIHEAEIAGDDSSTTPAIAASGASGDTFPPLGPVIPILEIANEAAFAVGALPWEDADGRARLTVVVKATYTIDSASGLTPKQLPIFAADIVYEAQPLTLRFESDLVPFKPYADIVLVGRAYAPNRQPVTELMCGLRVGSLRYGVAVYGDRVWSHQPLGSPRMSDAAPFVAMDLVYERAFGGIDAPGGQYCKENLVGTGFIGKRTSERVEGLRLPNLEDPRNAIRAWDTHPKPVGFGFYGRGWMPRLGYAGTYDEKHAKERAPAPPKNFSYRFFNGAHPELQVDGYLQGDEEVVLVNVCPDQPHVTFRLPGLRPRVSVARWTVEAERWVAEHGVSDDGMLVSVPLALESVEPVLDTLVFVPDEGVFYEVFRGVCALSSLESPDIARITVST
jgi:hypothetical protein